jgi:hypothetical protein
MCVTPSNDRKYFYTMSLDVPLHFLSNDVVVVVEVKYFITYGPFFSYNFLLFSLKITSWSLLFIFYISLQYFLFLFFIFSLEQFIKFLFIFNYNFLF